MGEITKYATHSFFCHAGRAPSFIITALLNYCICNCPYNKEVGRIITIFHALATGFLRSYRGGNRAGNPVAEFSREIPRVPLILAHFSFRILTLSCFACCFEWHTCLPIESSRGDILAVSTPNIFAKCHTLEVILLSVKNCICCNKSHLYRVTETSPFTQRLS